MSYQINEWKHSNEETDGHKNESKNDASSPQNSNANSLKLKKKKDKLLQSLKDFDDIHEKILKTKHPFERIHFIESKSLTPSQKAITCCIQLLGGEATEEQLVTFLQTNWDFIGKMNSKLPNNIPDLRNTRINLAVKKKSIPLFLPKEDCPTTWVLNTSPDDYLNMAKSRSLLFKETRSSDRPESRENDKKEPQNSSRLRSLEDILMINEDNDSFEEKVFNSLKQHPEGITLEALIEETKGYAGVPGLFPTLDHKRRVRAVLLSKKNMKMAEQEGNLWKIPGDGSNTSFKKTIRYNDKLPSFLRTVRLSDFTIDEFYNVLKENKIY